MAERKTRSGLGTYVTDMKVKRVVDVYRRPSTTVYNIVALNELARNSPNGTVHSAVRYEGRAATPGKVDGVPPIYLIGATARQQDLFDRIIQKGQGNAEFMANLGRIATHNTDGMWIIIADLEPLVPPEGMLNPYQAAPIIGGIAQVDLSDREFELQAYDMGGSAAGASYDAYIVRMEALQRSRRQSDSTQIEIDGRRTTWGAYLADLRAKATEAHEEGDIRFARNVIHEMFHWGPNARHIDFVAPTDMAGLTTLLGTTPADVLQRVIDDPTYNPSDRVLENLAVSLNLNVPLLNATLVEQRGIFAEERYRDLQVAIFDGYEALRKANPNADFDFAALRKQQILKLKDGAPLNSENPNDHEPTEAFARTFQNAVATRTTAITARTVFLRELNGRLGAYGVDEGGGPWAMAQKLRDDLDGLNAELEVAETRLARKALRKRIHLFKGMLAWCETRAGYVMPEKEAPPTSGTDGAPTTFSD